MMRGRLKAMLLLAFALLRTLWRLAWKPQIVGLERFRENYAEDGLKPVSEGERREMADFGRCIACSRCNRGDDRHIIESKGQYAGTMGLVLAASRSMPDYRAATLGFAHLSDVDLEQKERLCPTRVPLRRLAAFVRSNAAAARISLPASQGAKRIPSSMPPHAAPPPRQPHESRGLADNPSSHTTARRGVAPKAAR